MAKQLLVAVQPGFCQNHSTETVLLKGPNDLLMSNDGGLIRVLLLAQEHFIRHIEEMGWAYLRSICSLLAM